ncbi:hypothetical protein GW17_00011874 [Ensete ventricosum]|nr:hypothetical protein GW17_00011874 [Ensete ventricosum]
MDEGAIDDFKDGLILKSTYQSASRSVHEPTATGRYCGFSLISSDTALYQAITVEISTVTAQYRSIMVDFNHLRPLSGDISLAAAGYDEGRRSKKKREKKGENLERCHPLTIRQQLDYQRRLRPKNLGTVSQMRTSQGRDFFPTVFSSFEATRKRG